MKLEITTIAGGEEKSFCFNTDEGLDPLMNALEELPFGAFVCIDKIAPEGYNSTADLFDKLRKASKNFEKPICTARQKK